MRYRTVIFDCDSTLSAMEGIEELARDHREEIARLTALAMDGKVRLEEVYVRRLDLIRPTHVDLERVGQLYIEHLVPGAVETIRQLRSHGVVVRILSGGLAPAVRILGRYLGLPDDDIAAVEVRFGNDGNYLGVAPDGVLTRSGGKCDWVRAQGNRLPQPILLIGDGATDLEARPAIAAFAAFTGVVRRPDVVAGADLELTSLRAVPELVLNGP